MDNLVDLDNVVKSYGKRKALDSVSLKLGQGRILGLIGPNGAGKTTLLRSIMGLLRAEGGLTVLGYDPWKQRAKVAGECAFIADTATLPSWARIRQIMTYLSTVHPRFSLAEANRLLKRSGIDPSRRIKTLSKGLIVQVHLALVLAIDAKLLLLDEPTLGLDLLFRKTFYTQLLNDYCDGKRTIIVSTHEVDEVENILTDAVFIKNGKIILSDSMDEISKTFTEITVPANYEGKARALGPIAEHTRLGEHSFLFESANLDALKQIGASRRPSLAEIFVAKMQ